MCVCKSWCLLSGIIVIYVNKFVGSLLCKLMVPEQEADVGLGIFGKEGKQAALAADFAVTQFSHISRLIRM